MIIKYKPFIRLVSLCLLILMEGSTLYAQNTLDLAGLSSGSPAYVAFSTRRLSTSYLGNAMQVRRSSDNTTQNIGFTPGGDLDVTALLAFVGAGNGYVSIWYDQSGNGRNMTQGTAVNQPRIVNSGTLDTENSKPFIRFFKVGTYNSLQLSAEMNIVGMVSVVNKFAPGARGFLLGHTGTAYNWHDQPPKLFATYASTSIINSQVYQNGVATTGSAAIWNSTLMVNTVLPQTPSSGTAWDNIGRDRSIYNHTEAGGGHTELIAFSTVPSSPARTDLEKNQLAYFGITRGNYLERSGRISTIAANQVNKFGHRGASSLGRNGETVPHNLPAAPSTTNLTLSSSTTANLTVTMSANDGTSTTAGICWGTSSNPTIAGSNTSVPVTGLSLTATMTSLSNGTTYYVRSYVTNSLGTSYGNELSFTHVSPGYAYQGGKVAYIYQPGDPGYVAGEVHGLIAAAADLTASGAFGCNGTNITGAEGAALGTGQANTASIIAQCATAQIAARVAASHNGGGFTDWFLPSIAELTELFNSRSAIGGFGSPVRYWSSTEGNASPAGDAQIVLFNANGDVSGYAKSNNNPRVRSVRYF